ncbi:hypothetical protein [Amycolatopsis sp. NPDC059021]|uniref:hypothetical protein n=1 Tax=Amycolatopsis sp. NPDC059021 TaxID=3346704 RepID=UPI00367070A6
MLSHDRHSHPLDALVNDPSGKKPMCDKKTFASMLDIIAAENAPRLFAIFQEYGDRVDAKVAGWGMAFEEHAEVVSVDRSLRIGLDEPRKALPSFNFGTHIRARLVWVDPAAARPAPELD